MEQKPIVCGDRWPSLPRNYPWMVAQNLDGLTDQMFCTIHDQLCHYKRRISKLLGRRIQGYFYGWVIMSNNNMWSLWKPTTNKIINLPPLTLNDSEIIGQCCLSSSPDDPMSVLLLTLTGKATFLCCRLGFKRDRLRWTKRPYTKQLKKIIDRCDGFLHCVTSFNGKVYALCNDGDVVIEVDFIDTNGEVLINLSLLGRCPHPPDQLYPMDKQFPVLVPLLKGSSTDLFYIIVAIHKVTKKTLANVYLFNWDVTGMSWKEMVDIKDAIFFVDLAARNNSVYYNHAVASELGGYVHIRDEMSRRMYAYNVEYKTISLSPMDVPTSHVSLWECRLEGDHEDSELTLEFKKENDKDNTAVIRSFTDDEAKTNESHLLNLPFHLLEMLMGYCTGVEYMSFRATCKRCHLAAPMMRRYSLVSPWLMVVDMTRGIINFMDPRYGGKYFMKRSRVSSNSDGILCSRFGWLLFRDKHYLMWLFNPFTSEIHKLPILQASLNCICFSTSPASPGCIVVGFWARDEQAHVIIHFVGREESWRWIRVDFGGAIPRRFSCPTFCGQDLYVLCDEGEVYVIKNLFKLQGYYYNKVAEAISCSGGGEYYLVKRDEELLLVIEGEFGEYVDVFKLNECTKAWEKIECLGRYMIYIGGPTCLCTEAKVVELENTIFFPRLHSKNRKVVFYSLETRRYHTFDGKNVEDIVGIGAEHVYPHAWIDPTWS